MGIDPVYSVKEENPESNILDPKWKQYSKKSWSAESVPLMDQVRRGHEMIEFGNRQVIGDFGKDSLDGAMVKSL